MVRLIAVGGVGVLGTPDFVEHVVEAVVLQHLGGLVLAA